jgi:transposase
MSSIEPNSDNGQPPLGRKDQSPRKRESFDLLDPDSETYQCVSQEASLYIGLIEQCDEEGRQPSERDYKRLAPELGVLFNTIRKQKGLSPKQVVHFNTVRNRFKRFVKEGYDGLLDHSPGPEAGSKLTKKQRRVIEGMCFKRRFDEQVIDDVIYYVLRHADYDEIYDEVIKANRGVVNVSRSTVERAVQRFVKANGPAITLAHEGDKAFEKKHQPHTTNRVPGSNYMDMGYATTRVSRK